MGRNNRGQPNNIIEKDNYYLIELQDLDGNIIDYAKIDKEDLDLVKEYKWYKSKDGYAVYSDKSKKFGTSYVTMHGLIANNLAGFWYTPDHISKDRLDNRKNNLRIADRSEQQINHNISSRNSTGVIGVSWQKRRKHHWRASLKFKEDIYNEYYDTKEEAIIARLNMESKLFWELAPQINLFEKYGITIQN